jgi:4,5-dihydroxyphthalate decarboxylase
MNKLSVSMSVGLYDRTFPLFDGQVQIEGCDLNAVPLLPEECFHRAFKSADFDITEMSLSSHTVMTGAGKAEYIGIPAFTSRVFRHSGIYIRTDRGIKSPEDLKGKVIGIPEYQQTANVFIRGFLQDDHSVKATDILWRSGGIEEPGRGERAPISLPPGIDLQSIPNDRTLSDMLAKGEIDGMMTARVPSAFINRVPHVDRLYPNYVEVEEAYYRKTKIFPIMHLIGIRKSLVEKHPWLPVSVYKAYAQAKAIAIHEMSIIGHLAVTLPWPVAAQEHAKKVIGEDYWSYGNTEGNRYILENFMRWSLEQGLIAKPMPWEALFAPQTLDLSKI